MIEKPSQTENCQYEKSWHATTAFSSTTSKKTDIFPIKGDKWKFTWSCEKANSYDGINIAVYKEGSNSLEEYLPLQKCPATPETSYVYNGNANYYFDIMIANINSWTIKVEDWY